MGVSGLRREEMSSAKRIWNNTEAARLPGAGIPKPPENDRANHFVLQSGGAKKFPPSLRG
ncbi:MAG: hypothetical protein DMG38_02050 [Acidobacteria bacterium]|nr:MAG: hypothetical protein DMG38_02050 [Acidobacteriota bacterium]